MTIYECLGISEFLIDETIPVDLIIENIDRDNLKHDADVFFRDIERVSIRASFNRGNHYMQVIEVELNSADYIEEISMLIQNAIRYPILFIFVYKERYLLIRRNFNLTMSTEHVSSIHIGFCSNWIYKEHLEDDLVSLLDSEEIVDYYDEEFELQEEPVKTVVDNGDYYFDDIIGNAIKLNYTIINSDVICLRFLIDWFKLHIAGSRIGIYELLNYIYRAQAYQMIGEHLFVEKDCISYALSELEHSRYMLSFGKTGRRPVVYFKGIKDLATHTEADNLMSYLLNGNIVSFDVEVSGEEIVSRELKKYIHFVPSNTMPVAPTYCASKSRFVDRTIHRYQLGKYHSIEDQDLRYIIVRKLRNNGYRKLEQFRSISIKTMDFLDEAMTIELLLCMDKYKIRFKECEKNKYPDIGDYIKAHYCCTECGEELDEIHCLNGKCLCKSCNQKSNVNTSEMVEESENNIIIANELARFEKNSSHIQSIDIDNSIEKYEDYTISINTIVLKQKRLAVCFDLKTADNFLIKNLEVKDVFLELNSGKVYLDEPYKISKLINGMEDNGDAILINKVFLYWNSTNENFATDRPRYIHLVLQNTYTSTHCLYDFEIKADDKVELCKCIGELDYLEYKKQITKQNVKRILSVIQNNIHDRASIKICLDNISITEVKSLFDSQYVVEDGVVYDKNKTTLIMCIGRERIDSIIIPDTVETICRNAFSDTRIIDDIVFSNQLKKIEAEAFLGVCFVNKINLPNTITEIAEKAFYKSTIPSDYINIPTSLENIGDNIFPLEWSLWHPISWNTISKNIKDTFFTANYKMIFGAEHRPMFIDSGMNYDFSWEYNVENELHIFATGDFSQTRWESDRETEWREYAGEIKKLIFHEGITSISGNAFEGCNNISEVILPSTLCHLNAYTLKDTIWYKNLSSGFVTVGDGCLVKAKTDETILVIPENVKYVSRVVDSISTRDKLCPNVKHIELGNNVHTLLPFAFADSSIESVLFNANLIELKQGCLSSCRELKFICLPNSVEIIGYSAFAHSKDLRCIVLSESLKVIDCTAFNGCNKLKKIIVPFSKKEFSKKVQTSLGHDSFPYSKCIYSTTVENRCIKSENELILRNNVIRKEDTKNLMRENDEKLLSKHPIIRAYLATKLRKYGLRTMDDLKKWGAKNVWKHVYENEKHYKLSFNNLVKLVMAEEGIDELSEERLIELYEFADSVAGQKIERKLLSDYREDDSFIGEDTLSKETKHKAHPLVEESFKSQKISSQNEIDVVDSGKTLDFSWELNSKNELYITARGNEKDEEAETLRLEEERLLTEKEHLLEEERLKEKARIAEAKRRYIEREKANRKGSNFYTGSIKVNNTNDTSENGNQYAEDKYAEEKARIAEAKRRYIERERTVHKNIESELNIVDSKKYTVSNNQEQITFNGFEDASLVHEQLSLESIRDDLEVEEKANNDEMLYIEKLFGERKPLVYVLNQIREKRCNEEIERLVAKRAQAVEQLKKYSVQLIDVLAQIADKKTKEAEEEVLRIAEQKRLEEARTAEEKRKQEEARRYEEECRKAEEARILEEKLRVEKMRQLEEELQKAEEAVRRLEEEKRQAEEKRIAEEKRRAEEAKHLEERIKAERMKESYRKEKRCQYCGGKFKGIFKKRCSVCGKPKDY